MSWHDLVLAQTSNICITLHAALNAAPCMCRTICDVTSSKVLGRLAQCEQKGSDRGRWVSICTQRVITAWLHVHLDLAVKSLSRLVYAPKG